MDERWRGLTACLVLNVTFVAFEALAIATIMPLVVADLGGVALYGWVFSAFVLGYALSQAPAGRFADRIGPRKALTVGAIWWGIFTALSATVSGSLAQPLLALVPSSAAAAAQSR